jgi:hypothetical protein
MSSFFLINAPSFLQLDEQDMRPADHDDSSFWKSSKRACWVCGVDAALFFLPALRVTQAGRQEKEPKPAIASSMVIAPVPTP